LYLAICGNIGQRIVHSLEEIFLQAKQQGIEVALGFDQGEEGRKMTK